MTLVQRVRDYPRLQTENQLLAENQSRMGNTVVLLQERLAELELALDDIGWARLDSRYDREFSKTGLNKIARTSRLLYLWNPLIRRAVNLRAYYTWAQGIEVSSEDDRVNDIIQEHMSNPANSEDLYGEDARLESDEELHNTGNLFSVLFTSERDGRVDIRSVPSEEITSIVCSPHDRKDIWFYERQWNEGNDYKQELYPDVLYRPTARPPTIDNKRVNWDAPVAHLRAGGGKFMKFGVPETYPALDWARAHKTFLEDWVALVRSLSRFAYQVTSADPAGDKTKFDSTFARGDSNETNPAPLAGSIFFGDEMADIKAVPKTGATVAVSDSRELRLMVASAMELPDTFLSGDVDVGNFATSRTLDRPTEMMVKFRQKRWANYWRKILRYVLEQQVRRRTIPGRVVVENGREVVIIGSDNDLGIDVRFPDVLEHDTDARITAIIKAATLDGKTPAGIMPEQVLVRELLSTLGIENVEDILAELELEQQDEASRNIREAIRRLEEAVREHAA